ncbi:glycosyltransferase family 2 protein [Tessaracoccus palaemonis]|uniref:Glycosyltransferase family 2 protein n=1 Tax=Tessaracoccus palaemonis TaxID=2829499 RepID=A0ABX8SKJ5_9ACTN|nr:glycosyltransferase family 2 protein [Tessaracoccus palaemonis]QXT62957.1 glycosyltransferase family 2 protein [Tessaracoccus palaemonis]
MPQPDPSAAVTAIIPFHGDPRETLPLLDALTAQTSPPGQIIVCDDASPVPFPPGAGYTVVRREHNGGFGRTVNTAARRATGKLLLVLNSDLSITPAFLGDLLAAVDPSLPCIASPAVLEGGSPAWTCRRWPTASHHTVAWLTPLARYRETGWWHRRVGHDTDAPRALQATATDWLMGACLLIPRQTFEALGGFDERFFMNSEEVDLQRRAHGFGVSAIYLPTVQVGHVGGGSSAPERRRGWLTDSWFRYAAKWGGARRLLVALRAATEINFLWNLQRQLRGKGVDARSTRAAELKLIRHGWQTRAGEAR